MDFKADLKKYVNLEKVREILADQEKRMYVILGSAALFTVLYLFLLVVPAASTFAKVSRSISETTKKVEVVNDRLSRLSQLTARLEGLREEHAGYAEQLPAQKEISRFLEGLASTARNSGVTILSVRPLETKGDRTAKYYSELPVLISAKSGYHQLGAFVNDLESGGRFMSIPDLRISYDAASPRRHNVNMALKVYVSMDEVQDAAKK
jgi:Tfp pilus assembly protein PilO